MTAVQTVAMIELARRAGLQGEMLVTRPAGARFAAVLETTLREVGEGRAVLLDAAGIDLIDASFADEAFAALAARRNRRRAPQACLILRLQSETSRENLEMALSSRPARERGLRNCVLPVATGDGDAVLVGKAEGHVGASFAALRARGTLTARELADLLDLDIVAASTRLKALFDLGLCVRTEVRDTQGKQYVYAWPL